MNIIADLRNAVLSMFLFTLSLGVGSVFLLPKLAYAVTLLDGDAKPLVQSICSDCHPVQCRILLRLMRKGICGIPATKTAVWGV